jgi:hypothetical protein
MSEAIDREELRRDLADALSAIQKDHSVAGLDVLADASRNSASRMHCMGARW